MEHKKGQYFSLDAIVASIIFIIGLSLLINHWFAIRTQVDDSSFYLESEAHRLANLLLSPGSPPDWYDFKTGVDISKPGFSVNNSQLVELIYSRNINEPSFDSAESTIGKGLRPPYYAKYEDAKDLMSTGADYYIVFSLALVNEKELIDAGVNPSLYDKNINAKIGKKPEKDSEIAKVNRVVFTKWPLATGDTAYYLGNMTVITWFKSSR